VNNKAKSLAVRFSAHDWSIINQIAKKNGTWASTWIREVVINELVRLGKRKEEAKSGIREKGR
jgi:predicted DNA binding CopG/RHH family protein